MANMGARDRLIVALDVPTVGDARALVARLGSAVTFYKIGLELVMSGGLDLARELVQAGKHVFLDMKLLDIENTVERATRNAAATGATFLTVHAHDAKTLRAAVAGKAGTGLEILGVTVLTNLDAGRHPPAGHRRFAGGPRRAPGALAREVGCDGVVASGLEAARVRAVVGSQHGDRDAGHPAARWRRRRPGTRCRPAARRLPPAPTISWSAGRSSRATDPAGGGRLFVRQIEAGLANARGARRGEFAGSPQVVETEETRCPRATSSPAPTSPTPPPGPSTPPRPARP